MKCLWCSREATQGGRAPAGVVGQIYALACDEHSYLIEKLGYMPRTVSEVKREQMLAERESAKK